MNTERTEYTEDTERADRDGRERVVGQRAVLVPDVYRSFATDVASAIVFSVDSVYSVRSVFRYFPVFLNIRVRE